MVGLAKLPDVNTSRDLVVAVYGFGLRENARAREVDERTSERHGHGISVRHTDNEVVSIYIAEPALLGPYHGRVLAGGQHSRSRCYPVGNNARGRELVRTASDDETKQR